VRKLHAKKVLPPRLEKKLVTDTNRPAKRWLGALWAAPRSGEISPKNYRNRSEYQSQHHCDREREARSEHVSCAGRSQRQMEARVLRVNEIE